MRRIKAVAITLLMLTLLAAAPGLAAAPPAQDFPEVIDLPNGWQPEGIVAGRDHILYSGSLDTGAIYAADARTGEGKVLVPPQEGRVAAGLDFDQRTGYLYVAGASTGHGYVYDTNDGSAIADFEFTTEASFVNDVIVTRQAAYFTDSSRGVLYRVSLETKGRPLGDAEITEISLGPDFAPDPAAFKANGIVAAPNGKTLVVVNSTLGNLYRVDVESGEVTLIDLGGPGVVASGDGLLLVGRTLYVVQNFLNQIAVVKLNADFTAGEVVETLTHPEFDVPTTLTWQGSALYVVNARFSTPPTPDTAYWIVRLPRN